MKLSIIIPTFNSGKTLTKTLESIVAQNFVDLECWLIDANSTDNTLSIIENFNQKHTFIKYISEADNGIYDAMNKGINFANGDYLYFMGSDDVFYDANVLNNLWLTGFFMRTDLIYGDVVFKHSKIRYGEEKNYLKLIKNLENICHQSVFYSKNVFTKIGYYDLRFPIYADFNLNIKCFKDNSLSKIYINQTICVFNEKGTSYSARHKDNYIEVVHQKYVTEHEDIIALYDTVKFLEQQLANVYLSKDYLLGKKLGNWVRKIRNLGFK